MQSSESTITGRVSTVSGFGLFSQESLLSSVLDPAGRKILVCTMDRGKTVEEISAATGIPLSTCYRKIAELSREQVVVIERMMMSGAGKKYAIYRSAVASIHIDISQDNVRVSISPNPDVVARLQRAWVAPSLVTVPPF